MIGLDWRNDMRLKTFIIERASDALEVGHTPGGSLLVRWAKYKGLCEFVNFATLARSGPAHSNGHWNDEGVYVPPRECELRSVCSSQCL